MKKRAGKKLWLVLTLILTLFLIGCHTSSPIQPNHGFDILKHAKPIPTLTGQGIAVFHALAATGIRLQEALDANLHVVTLAVQDPEGYPHAYYNFIAPVEMNNPLEFGLKLKGDEWREAAAKLWRTEVIGASTAREILTYEETGLRLLKQAAETAESLGGRTQVRRIVTLQGQNDLYLEDQNGAWWPVGENRPLSEEEKEHLIQAYHKVHEQNNNPELAQALEKNWEAILRQAQEESITTNNLLDRSGNLNVSYALSQVQNLGIESFRALSDNEVVSTWERQNDACLGWWVFRVCFTGFSGGLDAGLDDIPGGALQNAYYYGYPGVRYKNPAPALPGSRPYLENDAIGCGPASFVSVTWWLWKHKDIRWYGKAYDGTPPLYTREKVVNGVITYARPYNRNTPPSLMAKPDKNGQALIGRYMSSFEWRGQTATLPQGYLSGAQYWLSEQRKTYSTPRVDLLYAYQIAPFGIFGRDSSHAGPFFYTSQVANIVRHLRGTSPDPVAVLFWIKSKTMNGPHYSTIYKYRVVYYPFISSVLVWPVDDPDHAYSITNPWGLVRGAFAFVKR